MKTVLGQAAVALLLFALGGAFWTAGQLQARVADAHQDLALLRYGAPVGEYNDIEQSMGVVTRVPWLTDSLLAEVREHRATAQYWQSRYDTLALERDATGAPVEQEPAALFLAANAGYRASQREGGDRQTVLRGLDTALKTYADVLKKNPGHVDAAYNYEYTARLRDTLAKSRPGAPSARPEDSTGAARGAQKRALEPGVAMAGDLPAGPTIHGRPGAPPPTTDMKQFKLVIPERPDERGGTEAGKGKAKVRKG